LTEQNIQAESLREKVRERLVAILRDVIEIERDDEFGDTIWGHEQAADAILREFALLPLDQKEKP
jgi:hypothetical protein